MSDRYDGTSDGKKDGGSDRGSNGKPPLPNSAPSAPHQSQEDFNRGGMIAFVGSMAFTMLYFVYVAFMSGGIDLKEVAPEEEQPINAVAGAAAAAPDKDPDVSGIKEPWIESPELVAHGKHLFQKNCVLCHGQKGLGDGPAGASLNPKPRNLVEGKWKKGGTSLGLFDVLSHGLPPSAMASYAHLPPADRWSLVAYIRSITQNKVANNEAELKKTAPTLK